jgi:potassium voltage-gated channel Shal-related subfamily D protein 2
MADPIPLSRIQTPVSSQFLTESPRRSPPLHDEDDMFPHSMSSDTAPDVLAATLPAWKRNLYCLLEQPTSSQSAFLIHILTTGLIIISAVVTVMETVEILHYVSPRLWFGLETSLVVIFTVEFLARCCAWSGTWMGLFKWITCAYGIKFRLCILLTSSP